METSVSIVIPSYNKEKYIKSAIESAINQTHRNCEVIVIDDGSSDTSMEIIRSFGNSIQWATQSNGGGSKARNHGLKIAAGDWIQFLDADDTISPEKLELQLESLKGAPKNSIAACGWGSIDQGGTIEAAEKRGFWSSYDRGIDLLIDTWSTGGYLPCHSWLIPTNLARELGGWNENLSGDDDGEFFGRILTNCLKVVFTDQILAYYRCPEVDGVSQSTSHQSATSFYNAWLSVAAEIQKREDSRTSQKAIMRRLRYLSYSILREHQDTWEKAVEWDKQHHSLDFSPSLPMATRILVGLFGLERGLNLRQLLRTIH